MQSNTNPTYQTSDKGAHADNTGLYSTDPAMYHDADLGKHHDSGLTGHHGAHHTGAHAHNIDDTSGHHHTGEKPSMGEKIKHQAAAVGEKAMEKGYELKSKVSGKNSKGADLDKAHEHKEAYQQEKMAAKGHENTGHVQHTY